MSDLMDEYDQKEIFIEIMIYSYFVGLAFVRVCVVAELGIPGFGDLKKEFVFIDPF